MAAALLRSSCLLLLLLLAGNPPGQPAWLLGDVSSQSQRYREWSQCAQRPAHCFIPSCLAAGIPFMGPLPVTLTLTLTTGMHGHAPRTCYSSHLPTFHANIQ